MSSCVGVARAKGVHATNDDMDDEEPARTASGWDTPVCICSEPVSLENVLKRGFFDILITSESFWQILLLFWNMSAFRLESVGGSSVGVAFVALTTDGKRSSSPA